MKYFLTWLMFVAFLVIIWFVFIYKDWFSNLDQKLTFILASFGIAFGVFQFLISHIKEKEKWLNEKRLDEYKRIRELIQAFINTLNAGLSDNLTPIETENILINLKNELAVNINSNDPFLFQGISKQSFSKKLDENFQKIILNTSKARQEHQRILKSIVDSKELSLKCNGE